MINWVWFFLLPFFGISTSENTRKFLELATIAINLFIYFSEGCPVMFGATSQPHFYSLALQKYLEVTYESSPMTCFLKVLILDPWKLVFG